jgi:hypothetical protein
MGRWWSDAAAEETIERKNKDGRVAPVSDAVAKEILEHRGKYGVGARMHWRWSDVVDARAAVVRCGGCGCGTTSERNPTGRMRAK